MKDVMGLINLSKKEAGLDLGKLTKERCTASVPFGGRYRIIDFILSNMVNSGIYNVGVLVLHQYRSLLDHLGSGKEWDLHRKRDGLFILPPAFHQLSMDYKGDMQNFGANMDYLEMSSQKIVIIAGSNVICNTDFREVVDYHREMKADITVLYEEKDPHKEDLSRYKKVEVDEEGRVKEIEDAPGRIKGNKIFLDMVVINKDSLLDIISSCYSPDMQEECNFLSEGIIPRLSELKIYGFPHRGYLAVIDSLTSYYKHSMDLLLPEVSRELFFDPGFIYTKVNDEPPAKYSANAQVQHSLVANGCLIEGEVKNSILFRGVRVHKDVVIKDSIIMQKSEISPGATLENVIIDKDVHISGGQELKGKKNDPLVVGKKERR